MSKPLVSVIIPTYNYAHYISQAIDSILQQTYPTDSIEIIVYDDGSTDNTDEVVKKYADRLSIKYFFQQNKGKASATYNAILASSGKYIFNLDADDYFCPQKIEASVIIFELNEDIVHVSSPARIVYTHKDSDDVERIPAELIERPLDGKLLSLYFFKNHILYGGGSTYGARASVLKQIEIPDCVDMYIDEFLLLAIFSLGKSFFIKEPLSIWRVHKFNYSGNSQTLDEKVKKMNRLMASSEGVLSYLIVHKFDKHIIDIYRLHNLTRKISFKEEQGIKSFKDVLGYASEVFFKIRPSWSLIRNYYVLNRLIPTSLLKSLKGVLNIK
ncbi:MAG: glycosyltransferase family A protein [Ferruginibacter sp.]